MLDNSLKVTTFRHQGLNMNMDIAPNFVKVEVIVGAAELLLLLLLLLVVVVVVKCREFRIFQTIDS
jgi:hypothetical protein